PELGKCSLNASRGDVEQKHLFPALNPHSATGRLFDVRRPLIQRSSRFGLLDHDKSGQVKYGLVRHHPVIDLS
ncbi:MAG: hypothetical protein ACKPEY_07735, partial [Planctomycetota bacterium]